MNTTIKFGKKLIGMYSSEHIKYLKNLKRKKRLITFIQLSIIIIFIIIWQLLANFKLINTFITSSPSRIINTCIELIEKKNLFIHIWTTTYETIISFTLGTLIGCVVATILWWNKFLAKIIDPYLTVLNSLPKVALGPIIIIWAGANINSIIIMALLISVIITIINVTQSFNDTDPTKIKLMNSFNATKSQIFFKLILPFNFNTIISALKINVSMSLIGA